MRYETIAYIPLEPPFNLSEIMCELPEWIKSELIQDSRSCYISVEAHKLKVVDYLDSKFEIGKKYRFRKHYSIEVDKSEIHNYSQYHITVRALEWGRDIHGSIMRPTCTNDSCSEGSKLIHPVRVPAKKVKNVGFVRIHRPWEGGQSPVFLVAAWIKKLFDSEGIAGLDYETCIIEDSEFQKEPLQSPYLARINQRVDSFADEILQIRYLCEIHNIISSAQMINYRLYREDFTESDFHIIERVMVNNCSFRLILPSIIISRRVLQLLLKHKIRGLADRTFYLKEKFVPAILFDRITSQG